MVEINGTKFAENNKEFINSLFVQGTTATMKAKVLKSKVHFFDNSGALFAALVQTTSVEPFFVSATKRPSGKARYSFGLSERDKLMLGLADCDYLAEHEIAINTAKAVTD